MKFKMNRIALRTETALAALPVPFISPIVGVSGLRVKVETDKLILAGTDCSFSVQKTIHPTPENGLIIESSGEFILEARFINNILKHGEGETVSFEMSDNSQCVHVECGKAKFDLNTFAESVNIDFYPIKMGTRFTTDSEGLQKCFNATSSALPNNPNVRHVLLGIHIKVDGKNLIFEASDGFCLSRAIAKATVEQMGAHPDVILPRKPAMMLSRLIGNKADVKCAFNSNKIQLKYSENEVDTIIESSLIAGDYPTIGNVIPQKTDKSLTISSEILWNALDKVTIVEEVGKSLELFMNIGKDEILLEATNLNVGSTQQNIKGDNYDYSGNGNLEFYANMKYIKMAMKALNCETIQISSDGAPKPVKIQEKNKDDVIIIVIPLRKV